MLIPAALLLLAALSAPSPDPNQQIQARPSGGPPPSGSGAFVRRFRLEHQSALAAQGGLGPVEIDRSVGGPAPADGQGLRIGGRAFGHGFGTASTSLIRFDLSGAAQSFSSWVGIDDEVGSAGSVVFRVLADGVPLFDSGLLTGSDAALFSGWLDLGGSRVLELVVSDGGDGRAFDHADWALPTLLSNSHLNPIGDGANLRYLHGRWEAPMSWPLMAIHASLLPSGQILSYASALADQPGEDSTSLPHDHTRADLADLADWQHQAIDHPSEELYATGHLLRPDGRLLTFGGHAGRASGLPPRGRFQSSLFDTEFQSWLPQANMRQPRWGAGALTLGNGDSLALGGAHAPGNLFEPEVFDGLRWHMLTNVDYAGWIQGIDPTLDSTYPFAHLASDGRVFWAGWGESMGFFDTKGRGAWLGSFQREARRRAFGTSVLYALDRVLIVGGVDDPVGLAEATELALTIDISGGVPTVSPAAPSLFARADANGTLLADGSVLLSGGSQNHGGTAEAAAIRLPEIWNPVQNRWRVGAQAQRGRAAYSSALLLPDGRVWTGGGTDGSPSAELYSPPYLYRASGLGQLAPRPTIVQAPAELNYGAAFALRVRPTDTAARLTLVRLGSVTHGLDFEQRFLELPFTQNGTVLSSSAPVDGNAAPPGHYMLFVLDPFGVPSLAKIVRIDLPTPTSWQLLASSDGSQPTNRHETAMVEVAGRLYLMGGRGVRPVEEYDPVTGKWTNLGLPPLSMHHFQPLEFGGQVWVVSAFEGNYPNETPVANIHIFDPTSASWSLGAPMPAARNRGSAGTALYQGKFYLVGGNTLGHNGGAVAWFDVFDPLTNSWTTLQSAPHARDHFQAIVVGNKLVAAAGRETDLPVPFDRTVAAVDVFDFGTNQWATIANDIPTERAGTMAVGRGQYVVVCGGESASQIPGHSEVEALDLLTGEWLQLPGLAQGRHSGGIGMHSSRVYVAAGSGNQGGSPELNTLEVFGLAPWLQGASTNMVSNSAFDEGLTSWTPSGSTLLRSAAGIASPGLEIRQGSISQILPAGPSTGYRATALYRASAGAGTIEFVLEYLDAGGLLLGSSAQLLSPSTTLRSAQVVGVSPAATVAIRLSLHASGARVLTVDDISLVAE